jgi:Flp pilus assembly protein TadD
MRFADTLHRHAALMLLCAALAGCSVLPAALGGRTDAPATPASAPAPTAAASAPKPAVARAEPDRPVSPTAQRAFDAARGALRAGRTDEAERGFRALAQSNPELGGAHANLGVIYRQAGKLPDAVTALETAVRVSPQQPVFFNQLGITYRQSGQFAKAREAYESAIALDPAYAAPILNLGILNDLYLSDGPKALGLYDRYLALTPSGDAVVAKWVVELKNRKPAQTSAVARKEKE